MLTKLYPSNIDPSRVLAEDDAGQILRYGELPGLAAIWKERLPGRRLVFLLCANTVPHVAAYAGLHAAGHVVVLLPKSTAATTLNHLVELYRVDAIVRSGENEEIDVEILREPEGDLHPDLSICLSTSGSIGSPKLVRYSDSALIANTESIRSYLQIGPTEVAMAHLSFEYSFGMSVLHSHVAAGAKLLLSEHTFMQKPLWERMRKATSIAGVPYHFEMMLRLRLEQAELPAMCTLTQAGGHLAPALVTRMHGIAEQRGWKFHVMYGQTEAGPRISWLPHELVPKYPGSIGQAIPGVSISVIEDELVVDSPAIMMGYALCRADMERGDDIDGQLVTGDLAEEVDPGIFRITGRKSRFIKILGNRVSLQDMETCLLSVGHTVYCVGSDDNLQVFTIDTDTEALRQAAITLFSFPVRLFNIRVLPEVPRRPNGKIDYAELNRITMEVSE